MKLTFKISFKDDENKTRSSFLWVEAKDIPTGIAEATEQAKGIRGAKLGYFIPGFTSGGKFYDQLLLP